MRRQIRKRKCNRFQGMTYDEGFLEEARTMPMYTISILVAGKWRTVHGGLGRISKDFELHFGIRWTFLVTIPLQPPPPPLLLRQDWRMTLVRISGVRFDFYGWLPLFLTFKAHFLHLRNFISKRIIISTSLQLWMRQLAKTIQIYSPDFQLHRLLQRPESRKRAKLSHQMSFQIGRAFSDPFTLIIPHRTLCTK